MAGNIHINLSEEIEQDLLSKYQTLCDNLAQTLGGMQNSLEQICNQTRYKPVVDVVNTTVQLFNEEIRKKAEQTFQEWVDGDGSFAAASENSQAGEEALATARQIEAEIKDIFDNFWGSHPLGENLQIDTGRPLMELVNFDELKEIYTKASQNIESHGEDAVSGIRELGSDDPTYYVILPAMKAVADPIKAAFEQFVTKVDKAKEESESLKRQQESKNEEALEAATQTSMSAAEVAELMEMYKEF